VVLPELPLTPNGKVDRRALPDPAATIAVRQGGLAAPTDAVEEIIAGIWAEVLALPAVGTDQDFFEIGGHSLLATQVVSRMTEALQVMIPLPRFFEEPTVAEQAAFIRAARRAERQVDDLLPIVPVPRETGIPLSFAQQRLWFIDQLEPGSAAYNIPAAVRLAGRLEVAVLEWALLEVVRRHEALRTTFGAREGEPFQRIAPEPELPLPLVDLAELPVGSCRQEAERLAGAEASRPFDLAAGPLVRWTLLRLDAEEHLALVTMHHIVSDGWSAAIFLRELAALYDTCRTAEAAEDAVLAELPVQYADFAVWQRRWLTGEVLERQIGHWRHALAGVPPRLELTTDRPRPVVQSYRGATLPVLLPHPLAAAIAALGRQLGATPFMMLLAAFQTLLSRLTGQEDVVVGSPIAGRNRREIEGLIGFFVNTLVLRADLAGEPVFRQLVSRLRAAALAAYEHQDLPFERLVEELAPERSLAHSPLFQVVFALQNMPASSFELPGLALEALPAAGDGVAKFDLTFTLGESAAGFSGSIAYSTDLFDGTTVARWMEHLRTLLEDLVAHPERRVSELALLSPAERHQALHRSGTMEAPAEVFLLHRRFREQAAARPDAVAVTWEESNLSYGELRDRAGRLARRLRALGVGPDVRVGVCLDRSAELVTALLAVLEAGGAYVPLDPAYPEERLALLVADAGLAVVVTTAAAAGRLPATGVERLLLEEAGADGAAWRDDAAAPESLAYVIYTSGSTGRPKGVQVSHAAASRLLTATHPWFGFGPGDVWSLFHSFSFDFSVWEIWGALLHGGRLVVVPFWAGREPERFLDLLAREEVTVLNQTPSSFRTLARAVEEGSSPSSLRWVVFGGEALDFANLAPWFARHG
ncbi:MAG TPA: condensation domain-containing protein, partial [Thermoanaerobaculia bacterium]|nr:condensation domain-containing protein [Thermoanaerobaculia bacterium]